MTTRKELLAKRCEKCGAQMERVFEKNPFIDDFADQCTNPDCYQFRIGEQHLNAVSRAYARAEGA
jgi:ssDNA-binding Zn-finger/Zn-ribbon topoisomerase 1